MSGTSMATPIVAGLAALIKSARQNLKPNQIKETIMNTGDRVQNLDGLVTSSAVIRCCRSKVGLTPF